MKLWKRTAIAAANSVQGVAATGLLIDEKRTRFSAPRFDFGL